MEFTFKAELWLYPGDVYDAVLYKGVRSVAEFDKII